MEIVEMKKYQSAEDRFNELVKFKEKHQRMPSYKKGDYEDADWERSLYSWLQAMKMSRKGKGTAKCPSWLDGKAKENGIEKWFLILDKAREQFEKLLSFYKEFDRKPKRYKASSKEESKLAHWIHQMRQERKRKTKRYPDWLDQEAENHNILEWFVSKDKKEGGE